MVADAQVFCHPTLAVQYLCLPSPTAPKIEPDIFDVAPDPNDTPISIDLSRRDSALSCSTSIQTTTIFDSTTRKYAPKIRSGSHTDIGPRSSNEDEHIRIDDLCTHLESNYTWPESSSFYAVFDGHGGPDAAVYMKKNAMRFFFEDAELPRAADIDEKFLQDLETSHRKSFLLADQALADENSVIDSYCGTTALTALVLGRHLLIANAGDCRPFSVGKEMLFSYHKITGPLVRWNDKGLRIWW
ncbi:UNVERIFIED_CONTAM: putative protein phosphatase 2C 49 [Sesamum latifolium]|uniref:protein-serine/threonine phosphatase n=1 Tax=Sesamum latifolium TaxID=2727402 RepID=A0AAW2W0S6_9LAMI